MPNLVYDNTFDESGLDGKQPQSWDNYVSPYFKNIRTLLNTTGLDAVNLGVTAGQVTASKALVVDASRNLADGTASNQINNLTLSGTFTCGTVSITGGSVSGITDLAVADGGTGASTASAARTNLGLVIGSDVQAYDAELQALSGLTPTDGNFIVGNGSTFVTEDAATSRTSLGLGSIATQASNSVSITGGSVTGITDVTVADGGTGASDAAGARTNLGLVIGTNVQAYDAGLADIAGLATSDGNVIVGSGSNWVAESGATARTSLGLGSIATQASDSVSITGGAVTGITDITVADGGTGASNASGARTNLGVAIGSDVQAYDAGLADIAALATTDGNIIVGSGSNWVAESGATARTSLGLGSIATQNANAVSISGGSLTGMTSYSGGSFSGTTGTFSGDLTVATSALFVDASTGGDVGIGTTSIASGGANTRNVTIHNSNSEATYFKLSNNATGTTNSDGFDLISGSDGQAYVYNRENAILNFATNSTIAAKILANGDFTVDTDTLFVDASADRVGINAASPTEVLDVTGALKASAAANNWGYSASFFDRSGNDTRVVAGATSGNSSNIAFWTYNSGTQSQKAVITSDGKVGIAVSSPTSPLSIEGTGTTTLNSSSKWLSIGAGSAASYTANNIYGIGFGYTNSGNPESASFIGYKVTDGSASGKGRLVFATRDSTTGSDAPTERMTILSDGKTGIGTASPGTNLTIQKNDSTAYANAAPNLSVFPFQLLNENNHVSGGTFTGFHFNLTGDSANRINYIGSITESSSQASALVFGTDNGSRTEKLRITSAGLVKVLSDGLAINGQNTTHEANSLRIGQEGSGLAQFRAYGPDTSNRGSIEFVTDLSNGTASVRHITLKDISGSSGVGVGTQSPLARIHTALGTANLSSVTSNTQAIFEHTAAAGSVSRVAIIGGSGSGYSVLDFGDTSGSNNGGITYNHGADSMEFATVDGTAKVTLLSSGYLGVGSASPRYNLAVKGDNSTAVGIALDNDSGSGTLDITALGASYGAHGAAAGEIWFYSPDNINIGGATGNTNDIKFLGGGAERVRIKSAGDLLVGTSSAIASASNTANNFTFSPSSGYAWLAVSDSGGVYTQRQNDGSFLTFYKATSGVGSIAVSGSTTAYNTSSDYRIKENITEITDGITRIKSLKPSRFNFIADADRTVDGFVAHEVSDIVPEAITGAKDAVDDDGNPKYQGIDQSKLVPLLTAALQEAVAKIETLETKVSALEAA